MKIAFITTSLGMGGAEKLVCALADSLREKGHEPIIISLTGEATNKPLNQDIITINLKSKKTIASLATNFCRAIKIIRQFKPDVVHSHMVHANIFARLLRITTSIPRLICTAHSTNEGSKLRMLAYRLTDHLADLSTNVSDEAVQAFIAQGAVKPGRMLTMHNGIDSACFRFDATARKENRTALKLNENTQLLLAVGRLTAAKDYPNLLHSFARIDLQEQNIQLAIIGTGDLQAELQALANTLGIADRVHFLGLRRDVAQWMSAADIYVMSSAWEGMPLVLLEAMACERVVVATDCGGVREVVGEAGLLVPPRQSTQLAETLAKALNMNVDERAQIGSTARQRVIEHYSLEAATLRWLNIYQGKEC